jgi:hypothetical protein
MPALINRSTAATAHYNEEFVCLLNRSNSSQAAQAVQVMMTAAAAAAAAAAATMKMPGQQQS